MKILPDPGRRGKGANRDGSHSYAFATLLLVIASTDELAHRGQSFALVTPQIDPATRPDLGKQLETLPSHSVTGHKSRFNKDQSGMPTRPQRFPTVDRGITTRHLAIGDIDGNR
ncbi:hypothetical protein [Micromonospora sp. LOL_023]|uniref:hypothetical protein n=1 Tax=Micromonospora sp. LOL_023 TaxID=3345418 RepID=UPI003A83F91A